MRIEEQYGELIVCAHTFPANQIKSGQQWIGSGGARVTIDSIQLAATDAELDWITYHWYESDGEKKSHVKDSFSFQCRYCMIVSNNVEF